MSKVIKKRVIKREIRRVSRAFDRLLDIRETISRTEFNTRLEAIGEDPYITNCHKGVEELESRLYQLIQRLEYIISDNYNPM